MKLSMVPTPCSILWPVRVVQHNDHIRFPYITCLVNIGVNTIILMRGLNMECLLKILPMISTRYVSAKFVETKFSLPIHG